MKQAIYRWRRKTPGEKMFIVMNVLFLSVCAVVILYPILYQLYNSVFLYYGVVYRYNDYSHCTRVFSLGMWREVLLGKGFLKCVFNSIARTLIGTVLSLCLTTFLAFILSCREIRWRYKMSFFWVLTFYLDVGIIPKMIYYRSIGLVPSFWVYVLPVAINALYLVFMRTYMECLPQELNEAAVLDGSGYWKRFTKVVLPQCKPIIAAVTLFTAASQWYSWLDSLIYNRMNIDLTTLAYQYFMKSPLIMVMDYYAYNPNPRSPRIYYTPENYESVLFCMLYVPILILCFFCRKYYTPKITTDKIKK